MDRKLARAQAMKLVYEWEMGGDGGEDTFVGLLEVQPGEREFDFMESLFRGVVESVDAIDEKLKVFVRGWSLERVTRVDLAILRVAVFELMQGETAPGIVINEAVELANQYSTDKAGAFVNGVLGSLSRAMDAEQDGE